MKAGDALWLARPKRGVSQPESEYVLNALVERKSLDDLGSSIKDQRYMKQKHFMRHSGVEHLMYLVEGDMDRLVEPWVCMRRLPLMC